MQGRTLVNVIGAILPRDITGAAIVGQWISCKYYRAVSIVLVQGGWAGGTPAVTLVQARDVQGLDAKPLAFAKRYQQAFNTGATGFVESLVSNNTFPLPATANQIHLIEINSAALDSNAGFDCMRCEISSPGAFADLLCGLYLGISPRYVDSKMPNALAN
jgi:hypothetical protein